LVVHFLPFLALISETKLPRPMTVHILYGPYTIFANLQGLKATMNSQAKPQRSACHEGICLKLPPESWNIHDGFWKKE
jgi:hypothetical protein